MTPAHEPSPAYSTDKLRSMLGGNQQEANLALDYLVLSRKNECLRHARELKNELVEVVVGKLSDEEPLVPATGKEGDTIDEKAIKILARLGDSGVLALAEEASKENYDRGIKALTALGVAQELRQEEPGRYSLTASGMCRLHKTLNIISEHVSGLSTGQSSRLNLLVARLIKGDDAPVKIHTGDPDDLRGQILFQPRRRSPAL